jgi:hypothetical protein
MIAINVSKNNAMLFVKAGWRVSNPRPLQFLGQPIQWVIATRYLEVNLDTRTTWSPRIVQVRKKAAQNLSLRKSGLSIRNVLLYKQLIRPMMNYACPIW